jgi:myosin-5
VNFQSTGVIHSANIKNYLLEKSRVVFLQQAERNFHIFYQIVKTPELQEKYNLEGLEDYNYLNQSGVYDVKDVDDEHDLKVTKKCMQNIGFTQD